MELASPGVAARYRLIERRRLQRRTLTALKKNILVVANVTATSDELCGHLTKRAERQPTTFTLVIPARSVGGDHEAAKEQLAAAIARLQRAGLEVEGSLGDRDPIVAVSEAWDPRRHDEIVLSTLPIGSSKWLHAGLPERIFKLTGALVTHIVSEPSKPPVAKLPRPPRRDESGLGPLAVLAWGGRHDKPGRRGRT